MQSSLRRCLYPFRLRYCVIELRSPTAAQSTSSSLAPSQILAPLRQGKVCAKLGQPVVESPHTAERTAGHERPVSKRVRKPRKRKNERAQDPVDPRFKRTQGSTKKCREPLVPLIAGLFRQELQLSDREVASLFSTLHSTKGISRRLTQPGSATALQQQLHAWSELESGFPGLSVRTALLRDPRLATLDLCAVRQKLHTLQQIVEGAGAVTPGGTVIGCATTAGKVITAHPDILNICSAEHLQQLLAALEQLIGSRAARVVLARWPALFRMSVEYVEQCYAAWKDTLGASDQDMAMQCMKNPALLHVLVSREHVIALANELELPLSQVVRMAQTHSAVLNLSIQSVRKKVALANGALRGWDLTMTDLTEAQVRMCVQTSLRKLQRLAYVGFLRVGTPDKPRAKPAAESYTLNAPMSVLSFTTADFNARFPRFERWLRRKRMREFSAPGSGVRGAAEQYLGQYAASLPDNEVADLSDMTPRQLRAALKRLRNEFKMQEAALSEAGLGEQESLLPELPDDIHLTDPDFVGFQKEQFVQKM